MPGPGLGFGLLLEGGEGDLGGVEELAGVSLLDSSQEDAVTGAGDEVTDILIAGKRRHGQAEGYGGAALGGVEVFGSLQGRSVNLYPGLVAEGDGGVFEGGRVGIVGEPGGGGRGGIDHGGSSVCGLFVTDISIVRRGAVIICSENRY